MFKNQTKKIKELLIIVFILIISGLLIFNWMSEFTINILEDTRLTRAHQTLYSFKPYYLKPIAWFQDLSKNQIYQFSLGYILPTPLMFIFGDLTGFRLFHVTCALTSVLFIYLILKRFYKYSFQTNLTALILLVSSYGFVYLSAYTTLDQIAFMFFFIFLYFYFTKRIYLAGLFFLMAIFSKDPRIILASVPALILFIIMFDKQLLKSKNKLLYGLVIIIIFLMVQKTSTETINSFPFGLFSREAKETINLSKYFGSINWHHLWGMFLTAPLITILAVLGIISPLFKKNLKLNIFFLLTFISFIFFYFSTTTDGIHYIYFTYLFLIIFSAQYLSLLSIKHKITLIILSVIILTFSLRTNIYLNRPKVQEINQLREKYLPYSNEGYILSHGFDWGRYFHNKRYGNYWDWEWGGSVFEIKNIPEPVEKNIRLIIVPQRLFEVYQKSKFTYLFEHKGIDGEWMFYIPKIIK